MKYIYVKQEGDGCDYTIGCGSKLIPLVKYGTEDEKQEIHSILEDYTNEENPLSECMVVEKIQDLMDIVNSIKVERLNLKKEEEKENIRKEIEKLQRKLDNI